jgi:uncharacterized protein
MIVYIHGFGSSGDGPKAEAFRAYFESVGMAFAAPTLSYEPDLAVKTLETLIDNSDREVCLIGASLGGYYATYLFNQPRVKKVLLINPAVNPAQTLKSAMGKMARSYDTHFHSWVNRQLASLDRYRSDAQVYSEFMLLLQKGDAVLDYKEAVEKYDGARLAVEEGGHHDFEGIERYFETIGAFFADGDESGLHEIGKGPKIEAAGTAGDPYEEALATFLDALYEKVKKEIGSQQ